MIDFEILEKGLSLTAYAGSYFVGGVVAASVAAVVVAIVLKISDEAFISTFRLIGLGIVLYVFGGELWKHLLEFTQVAWMGT